MMESTSRAEIEEQPLTLPEVVDIARRLQAKTGKAPRVLVLGKSQREALENGIEMVKRDAGYSGVTLMYGSVAGIEVLPLEVDSYFRVITQLEWEVLETKGKLMGGHLGPMGAHTPGGLLLAECYCDYYEGKRKEESDA